VVATKPGKLKAIPQESQLGQLWRRLESVKASIRAKVEHPFHLVKNRFRYRKVRYRGLEKNTAQLHLLFALANRLIAKRRLWVLLISNERGFWPLTAKVRPEFGEGPEKGRKTLEFGANCREIEAHDRIS